MFQRHPAIAPHHPAGCKAPRAGFTLVELLVVMVIVTVLAMIAYPTYRAQVERTRRADAQSVLVQAAQYMERLYTENGCYNVGTSGCGGTPSLPYTKSPIDGTDSFYAIKVQSVSATAYVLRATPVAGGPEASAGILEITDAGRRGRDLNGDTDTQDSGEDHW